MASSGAKPVVAPTPRDVHAAIITDNRVELQRILNAAPPLANAVHAGRAALAAALLLKRFECAHVLLKGGAFTTPAFDRSVAFPTLPAVLRAELFCRWPTQHAPGDDGREVLFVCSGCITLHPVALHIIASGGGSSHLALAFAAYNGTPSELDLWLNRGANASWAPPKQIPAIAMAVCAANLDNVRLLLTRGATLTADIRLLCLNLAGNFVAPDKLSRLVGLFPLLGIELNTLLPQVTKKFECDISSGTISDFCTVTTKKPNTVAHQLSFCDPASAAVIFQFLHLRQGASNAALNSVAIRFNEPAPLSPLRCAALRGRNKLVSILIAAGADLADTAVGDGLSPLDFAWHTLCHVGRDNAIFESFLETFSTLVLAGATFGPKGILGGGYAPCAACNDDSGANIEAVSSDIGWRRAIESLSQKVGDTCLLHTVLQRQPQLAGVRIRGAPTLAWCIVATEAKHFNSRPADARAPEALLQSLLAPACLPHWDIDEEARDGDGCRSSALYLCAAGGWARGVQLLLAAGARPNTRGSSCGAMESAGAAAARCGHRAVAALLRRWKPAPSYRSAAAAATADCLGANAPEAGTDATASASACGGAAATGCGDAASDQPESNACEEAAPGPTPSHSPHH